MKTSQNKEVIDMVNMQVFQQWLRFLLKITEYINIMHGSKIKFKNDFMDTFYKNDEYLELQVTFLNAWKLDTSNLGDSPDNCSVSKLAVFTQIRTDVVM